MTDSFLLERIPDFTRKIQTWKNLKKIAAGETDILQNTLVKDLAQSATVYSE